jgi:S1-C subfamily serine protease
MLTRAVLICPLLATLLLLSAQPKATANAPRRAVEKDGAEAVFASTASKVVFLITRKGGELHARASGVILTADGYIATNYHALQGADAVEIRFFPDPTNSDDYQSFNSAKLMYADAGRDIAILKVTAKSLPFLECSAGCKPRVGETVYAIGNPKGLSNTISEGIVSALRSVDKENVLQHTAAISPGSSGGALVDSDGALLGMNSWQVADAQNLNFAISAQHLSEALAAARQSTIALSFPPDTPAPTGEPAASVTASTAGATGIYDGRVRNLTGQLSADFEIQVRQEAENGLLGCMAVHRPLYGSGGLRGTVEQSQVIFDVSSWVGVITFSGQREGDDLTGAYSVLGKNGKTQEGKFELRRQSKTLPINFDPKNCPDDSVIR